MTVGVVGTGRMGSALARALALAGESTLRCAGRVPDRPPRPSEVTARDVWRHSDAVLLAVPVTAALALLSGTPGRLGAGRPLIDATNPGFERTAVVPPGLSAGELIAAAAPTWQVVKAFNTVSAAQIPPGAMDGGRLTAPIAGAQAGKPEAFRLAVLLGLEPVDAGGIAGSRELEALAVLLARISSIGQWHGRIGVRIGPLAAGLSPERQRPRRAPT